MVGKVNITYQIEFSSTYFFWILWVAYFKRQNNIHLVPNCNFYLSNGTLVGAFFHPLTFSVFIHLTSISCQILRFMNWNTNVNPSFIQTNHKLHKTPEPMKRFERKAIKNNVTNSQHQMGTHMGKIFHYCRILKL